MKEGYGEFIKKHRIESGYRRQNQLAEVSGISPATISRIEKEIQRPEVETLKTIAPYLITTSLSELLVVCGYLKDAEVELTNHQKNYSDYSVWTKQLENNIKNILEELSEDGRFIDEIKDEIFHQFEGNMHFGPYDDFDEFYKQFLSTKEDEPDYIDKDLEMDFHNHYNPVKVYDAITKSSNEAWKEQVLSQLIDLTGKYNIKIIPKIDAPEQETELIKILNKQKLTYKGQDLTNNDKELIRVYLDALFGSRMKED